MAAAWLSACSHVSDRVVLLPSGDGRPSAVELTSGEQRLRLDQPYTVAEVQDGRLQTRRTDAATVAQRYGAVLAHQPARPQRFVVRFESNSNALTADAEPVLAQMRAALTNLPAPEVVVTGHSDRVGSLEANDRLSLSRAELVRELLVAAGITRAAITVVGRGEREPEVATADEVAEPRNRRVEIKIR